MISAIVAVDKDWGIGFNGDLLEHIPEDLKYFKEITDNHWVIMGRKTWDSLPKKPLLNRTNVVITKTPHYSKEAHFWTLGQTKLVMKQQKGLDFFIIGGGQIYEKLLPICDRVYVTKIEKSHKNVDTYFPNLDVLTEWKCIDKTEPLESSVGITYSFLTYERV